ncbi:MAG: site-specific integrase, partial [Thermoplasmatales archaeon]
MVLIPKPLAIQSSQKLSIDFFTDEQIEQILNEISRKIEYDKKRLKYHRRYFLLVKFLLRTGGRIDEILGLTPKDINLSTNTIRMRTLKQGKDKKTGLRKEKFRIIPIHPDLRNTYMEYLLSTGIKQDSEELLF